MRTPVGSSYIGALAWLTLLFSGCKQVEVIPAPDSGVLECKKGVFVFCDAAAPDQPSCARQDPSYKRLAELGPGPNLPTGCTVNFVGGKDVSGDCVLQALCRCSVPDEHDASVWTCYP